jgi:hypothetical protein
MIERFRSSDLAVRKLSGWMIIIDPLVVIQGASDMGLRLSETELQKSLDFCVILFNPTTPEQHEQVAKHVLFKYLLDVTAPVVDPILLESVLNVEKNPKVVAVIGWGGGLPDCEV